MGNREAENLAAAPIGVFDSGLGGLTVVREIAAAIPAESIVYLGDSARVPYGIKSLETVRKFAIEDSRFLLGFGPKLVVAACNTASAAAIDALESLCPVDVVDVIRPGAADALARSDGPIGVIGTEATVSSGAYERAIAAIDPDREVHSVACPLLVPIVEEGRGEDDPIVLHVLGDYLRDLQRLRPGALILGCTHYPLLAGAIAKLMGPDVIIVDSARATARRVKDLLGEKGCLAGAGTGGLRCFTTDNPGRFAELGRRFAGRDIDSVQYVATDDLEAHHRKTADDR